VKQRGVLLETVVGVSGAARECVVDEDGGPEGVGLHGGGQSYDVPPVAGGDQAEEPDGGVFGGVQRAGQIGRREPCVGEGLFVGVPPAGGRAQGVHGQFQRVGADQVHAGQTAAFVPGDLFADVH